MESAGINVTVKKPNEAKDMDYFDYDLVCVGSPSIQWHPAKPIDDLLKNKLDYYRKQGKINTDPPSVTRSRKNAQKKLSAAKTDLDWAEKIGIPMRGQPTTF